MINPFAASAEALLELMLKQQRPMPPKRAETMSPRWSCAGQISKKFF